MCGVSRRAHTTRRAERPARAMGSTGEPRSLSMWHPSTGSSPKPCVHEPPLGVNSASAAKMSNGHCRRLCALGRATVGARGAMPAVPYAPRGTPTAPKMVSQSAPRAWARRRQARRAKRRAPQPQPPLSPQPPLLPPRPLSQRPRRRVASAPPPALAAPPRPPPAAARCRRGCGQPRRGTQPWTTPSPPPPRAAH